MRGNCYVTCEALYHLLGGKSQGWKPMHMRYQGDTHWFLLNEKSGQRLDPTSAQFSDPPDQFDYDYAVGSGFLTKNPSKKALILMNRMVWQ